MNININVISGSLSLYNCMCNYNVNHDYVHDYDYPYVYGYTYIYFTCIYIHICDEYVYIVYILFFRNMHLYNWKDPCSWSSKLLETVLLLGAEFFSSESFKTSAQSCNPLMALRTFLLSLASPCDRCQVFGGGAFPFTTNLLPPIFGLGRGPGRSGTGPAMTGAFPKQLDSFPVAHAAPVVTKSKRCLPPLLSDPRNHPTLLQSVLL